MLNYLPWSQNIIIIIISKLKQTLLNPVPVKTLIKLLFIAQPFRDKRSFWTNPPQEPARSTPSPLFRRSSLPELTPATYGLRASLLTASLPSTTHPSSCTTTMNGWGWTRSWGVLIFWVMSSKTWLMLVVKSGDLKSVRWFNCFRLPGFFYIEEHFLPMLQCNSLITTAKLCLIFLII